MVIPDGFRKCLVHMELVVMVTERGSAPLANQRRGLNGYLWRVCSKAFKFWKTEFELAT